MFSWLAASYLGGGSVREPKLSFLTLARLSVTAIYYLAHRFHVLLNKTRTIARPQNRPAYLNNLSADNCQCVLEKTFEWVSRLEFKKVLSDVFSQHYLEANKNTH